MDVVSVSSAVALTEMAGDTETFGVTVDALELDAELLPEMETVDCIVTLGESIPLFEGGAEGHATNVTVVVADPVPEAVAHCVGVGVALGVPVAVAVTELLGRGVPVDVSDCVTLGVVVPDNDVVCEKERGS